MKNKTYLNTSADVNAKDIEDNIACDYWGTRISNVRFYQKHI